MSAAALATLSALPPGLVWQADRFARPAEAGLPTGFAALDAQLPGGGWPRGALIELLADAPGIGELGLLLPLLRTAAAERWIAWVAPPHLPYAPALAAAGVPLERLLLLTPGNHGETLWTIRQALASGGCGVVLAWLARADTAALRRLQLAAEESATPLFLFRPGAAALQPSPAPLRVRLAPATAALTLDILKRRGPASAKPVRLTIADRPAGGSSSAREAPERPDPALPASRAQPRLQTAPLSSGKAVAAPMAPHSLAARPPGLRPRPPIQPSRALDSTHDALVCADPPRPAAAGLHAWRR